MAIFLKQSFIRWAILLTSGLLEEITYPFMAIVLAIARPGQLQIREDTQGGSAPSNMQDVEWHFAMPCPLLPSRFAVLSSRKKDSAGWLASPAPKNELSLSGGSCEDIPKLFDAGSVPECDTREFCELNERS